MEDKNCLFCKILNGEIPSKKVYENEDVFAFEDINPQAPTHILLVPRKHIARVMELEPEDAHLIGKLTLAANELAKEREITDGYRLVFNNNRGAGQEVFHIHMHLLGGRPFSWPPG